MSQIAINAGCYAFCKRVCHGKLSTYAAWWIKQSIKPALANQSKTIRIRRRKTEDA